MTFHGRRRALRAGVVAATAFALAGAATGAVLESRLDDNVIAACRNRSTGVLKVPASGVACGGNEQPLQWNVRGAPGPPGPAGPASIAALRGTACTTVSGLPGVLVVRTEAGGVVTFTCLPAPPSEALPNVVLNEIDYDQVGADAGGFVELYNAGLSAAELDGLALVFVDGADGAEYLRRPLSGSLAPGAYLVVPVDPQNGSPDGVALYDTAFQGVVDALSYEGAIERAFIGAFAHTLVEGNPLPIAVADSNTVTGALARMPNGSDTNDSATDWAFTTTVTPGEANVPS
jgi:Lamin Tail Domain